MGTLFKSCILHSFLYKITKYEISGAAVNKSCVPTYIKEINMQVSLVPRQFDPVINLDD